jgi:hypothetical protein
MDIRISGPGYAGAGSLACFVRAGRQVLGVDIDADKLNLNREGRARAVMESAPVELRRYFQNLRHVFDADWEVLAVMRGEGAVIASVLSVCFHDVAQSYNGGVIVAVRRIAENNFMSWKVKRRACECGIGVFGYGRSKRGTSSLHFKKHWGYGPQSLRYEYLLVKDKRVPEPNLLNPNYGLFIKLWQRLPLANLIGPYIVKSLG